LQGFYLSLGTLTSNFQTHFQKKHPSLLKKYPEFKDGLCMVHATLFPYNNGITYMSIISDPIADHYETPQDMAVAMDKAVHAYRLAFPKDSEGNTKDVRVTNSPSVTLFRSLDPVKDAPMCRMASNFRNQKIPLTHQRDPNYAEQKEQAGATPILVNLMLWQPYEDRRHPRYDVILEQATGCIAGEINSEPFIFQGFKNAGRVQSLIDDHEPCPFHRRTGEECPPFAGCCKSEYLKRLAKAKQKANYMKSFYHIQSDRES
jgi:hypothetical protein